MPRRILVTALDLDWLRKKAKKLDGDALVRLTAQHFSCCIDTAKRILHRNDIIEFSGAKYQKARDAELQMWTRPCSGCGDTRPRPKWIYYCNACARRLGHDREEAY